MTLPSVTFDLRLVGDVANDAGLSARAEQGSLRPFEDFDALQVRRVDIEVAARQLAGLVVQIDGDVRKPVDRAAGLGPVAADTQASHEDLGLTRTGGRRRHIGQILDEVIESRDVQLLQGLAGERLDRDRHVLHVFGAALRGDGNFLDLVAGEFASAESAAIA